MATSRRAYHSEMQNEVSIDCQLPNSIVSIYDPTLIVDVPDDTVPVQSSLPPTASRYGQLTRTVGMSVMSACTPNDDCKRVFSGKVKIVGRLAFNRSDCMPLIEVPVPAGTVGLSIYSNDWTQPSRIVCVIEEMAAEGLCLIPSTNLP